MDHYSKEDFDSFRIREFMYLIRYKNHEITMDTSPLSIQSEGYIKDYIWNFCIDFAKEVDFKLDPYGWAEYCKSNAKFNEEKYNDPMYHDCYF